MRTIAIVTSCPQIGEEKKGKHLKPNHLQAVICVHVSSSRHVSKTKDGFLEFYSYQKQTATIFSTNHPHGSIQPTRRSQPKIPPKSSSPVDSCRLESKVGAVPVFSAAAKKRRGVQSWRLEVVKEGEATKGGSSQLGFSG